MGMAVGCNVGDEHAMFEPIHGSAPRHAGKDKVNPMAMILAVKEGLSWVAGKKAIPELEPAAQKIEDAVKAVLRRGSPLTYDLVGEQRAAPMSKVTDAILEELSKTL
jgi:3-isopropylmalate dehydrogenase